MPDSNGGECNPIGTDPSSGALIFDYQQPCPASEQLDIPVDTTKLTDGTHEVQVIVESADEDSATVLDQDFTTQNLTTIASTTPEKLQTSSATGSPSGAGPAGTASPTQPAAVYAFKLDKASAKLIGGTVRRRYLGSRLVLSGTVVSPAGVPAPGVVVTAQIGTLAGQGFQTVASTSTDAAGRFTLTLPRGDSRSVQLLVGGEAVSLKQEVRPNVTFAVRSLHGQELVFTGRVAIDRAGGPAPIVVLVDHTSLGWETVGTVQTTRTGRYRDTTPVSPRAIGQAFYFRASTPATALWQAASSTLQTVKVAR